jgi:Sulfotransferase family
MHETGSRDRARRRTVWDSWGDALSRRLWLLDGNRLSAEARRRTHLEDFGTPSIEPALSVLTRSLESEADLTPLGRFLMRMHLQGLLETRLRLTEAWRGQLEVADSSAIRRPLFITGMPRSGSTFLHELLTEDPDNRAPRVWEVMFPLPAPTSEHHGRDPRVRRAATCLWWFRRLAPQADSVFPMRAMTPHECVAIHSYTLLSEEFISTCRIPSYEAFLHAADLCPVYAWQRRFLQHLQSRYPTRRWVLKSPDHVCGLEALLAAFPDAVVIHTHRSPIEVLQSSCQLTEVLHGLFARPGKREQLRARETRVLAERMERFIRFRDAHPELAGRFIDVTYSELVAAPLAIVARIYRELDVPLSDVALERMRHLVSARSRYQNRSATTTQADLGEPVREQSRRFEEYCSRFGLPWQQARLR